MTKRLVKYEGRVWEVHTGIPHVAIDLQCAGMSALKYIPQEELEALPDAGEEGVRAKAAVKDFEAGGTLNKEVY